MSGPPRLTTFDGSDGSPTSPAMRGTPLDVPARSPVPASPSTGARKASVMGRGSISPGGEGRTRTSSVSGSSAAISNMHQHHYHYHLYQTTITEASKDDKKEEDEQDEQDQEELAEL